MTMNPSAICERIIEAFGKMTHPGLDNIVPIDTLHYRDSEELSQALGPKSWQSMTVEDVRIHCDALPLMSTAAFGYFLPAYMFHCLSSPDDVNAACNSILYVLAPPAASAEATWKWWRPRMDQFNPSQRHVILEFLEFEDERERQLWTQFGRVQKKTSASRALRWWRDNM